MTAIKMKISYSLWFFIFVNYIIIVIDLYDIKGKGRGRIITNSNTKPHTKINIFVLSIPWFAFSPHSISFYTVREHTSVLVTLSVLLSSLHLFPLILIISKTKLNYQEEAKTFSVILSRSNNQFFNIEKIKNKYRIVM